MTTTDRLPAGTTEEQLLASMLTGPLPAARLARDYDAELLRAELAVLGTGGFSAQRAYDHGEVADATVQDWRVLPLRSTGGDAGRTDPGGPGLDDYAYTPYSRQAPYMTSLLEDLPVGVRSARLMSLAPGAEVEEHRDTPYGLPAGWFRLHVPIVTNPGAVLVIDGIEYCWQPGTLWYGDFARPHAVRNEGDTTRVHLVVDCYVNQRLLELFPQEFLARMPWAETLLEREEVPLTAAERDAMTCDVPVPASFLQTCSYLLPAPAGTADTPGRIRVHDGRLVLEIDDGTRMALVHVGEGEFRPLCWTTERTVKVDMAGGTPVVRFRLRFGSGIAEHVRAGTPLASVALAG